ncbi:MAG: 16S rRNA (guanine(527)-N(7))-methyltransferase RsmG [Pirellulales bacterium]
MLDEHAATAHRPGSRLNRLPGARCLLQCLGLSPPPINGSTTVSSPESNFEPQTAALRELLTAAGIDVADEQLELLDRYRRLLWSWNERLNLTRHTTLEKFVARDVVDSYQLSLLLERGERVLDVGTGGGVPGVVLAILRPDLSISLCESTQKKARAVEAIVGELGLSVPVFATRAEEVLQISTFDTLVARALASLRKVLTWLAPHWDACDRLLLIKGRSWVEERAEARHEGLLRGLELRKAATYPTPQTGAENVILSIQRANP